MTSQPSEPAEPPYGALPLQPSDVDRLRLGWWSRLGAEEVRRLLAKAPGRSLWIPDTHEYILVGPWRHRTDVMHVQDLVAVRHPVELMRAAIMQAQEGGSRLFLAVEMAERRQDSFYDRVGLNLLENVISYELPARPSLQESRAGIDIRRVDLLTDQELDSLVSVDWKSFPWLWQNSIDEFREYFTQTGVELFVMREDGRPIGYLGTTVFPGWGHIDRLAVVRSEQGKGFGRLLTEFAINHLVSLGAIRIGLSTQQRNERSQALYSRLGFRRQVAGDYRIYGRALWQNDAVDDLVMGGA
jgi:ribosomal protein S18 acetylase RimI-like enzyme